MRVKFVHDAPAIKRVRFYPRPPAEVIASFLEAIPHNGRGHTFLLPTACKGGCWLPIEGIDNDQN